MEQSARHEQKSTTSTPEGHRDPGGFVEAARAVAGSGADAGRGGAAAQVQRLLQWAEAGGKIIAERDFESLQLISDETGEHEVRFRQSDQRAVKRTWMGTFAMIW